MSKRSHWRGPLSVALIWSVICCFCIIYSAIVLYQHAPKTDLFALLPPTQVSNETALARHESLRKNQSDILCLIQVPQSVRSETVKRTLDAWLLSNQHWIALSDLPNFDTQDIAMLSSMMTHRDQAFLEKADRNALLSRVYANASSLAPLSGRPFEQDPLGLLNNKLKSLTSLSPFHSENGIRTYSDSRYRYLLIPMHLQIDVMHTDINLQQAFGSLKYAMSVAEPTAKTYLTGTALFTHYAARTAQTEFSWLGIISSLSILCLALLWFKRKSTLLHIALITFIALAGATAGTLLLFGQIHLITLMFGTSLIGITVDYSAHYFCRRSEYGRAQTNRSLRPNLTLAFFTSLLAFGMMGLTPMPGLQQMAVFCCLGLLFAFISVLYLLPILDYLFGLPRTTLPLALVHFIHALPNFKDLHQRSVWLSTSVFAFFILVGCGVFNTHLSNNIQELNNFPKALIEDAQYVSKLSRAPATSQFVIFSGRDREEILQKEEQLQKILEINHPDSLHLVSPTHWISSHQRSLELARLHEHLYQELHAPLSSLLGRSIRQPTLLYPTEKQFRVSEIGQYFEPTWQSVGGQTYRIASIIGLNADNRSDLIQAVQSVPATRFIDFSNEIGRTLNHYRDCAFQFLLISLFALSLILIIRFQRDAWRAAGPVIGALILTIGTLGWLGHSLSLFNALSLILLLGLGVDYGIFVTAGAQEKSALPAVIFSALTTVLSFGLLSLTSTPALQTFGLTLAVGQSWLMLLTVLLRQRYSLCIPHA